MDLLPTDEQLEIVASVGAVLRDRTHIDRPLDDETWQTCAGLGWLGLALPEDQGGVGYGAAEQVLLFEQLGRSATSGPFLATTVAAHLAAAAGDAELRDALVSGAHRVALRTPGPQGDLATDAPSASHLLTIDAAGARLERLGGAGLQAVDGIDELVPLGRITSDTTLTTVAETPGNAIGRRATLLTAAMLAGLASATAEQSTDYAKDRIQFGQPIGSFQAVKHRCADMATRAGVATAQCRYAALVLDDGSDSADFHAEAAWVVAARAAVDNAQTNIQNHGGIGFTWEHSAHRRLTRARIWVAQLGGLAGHLAAALAASSDA